MVSKYLSQSERKLFQRVRHWQASSDNMRKHCASDEAIIWSDLDAINK